MVILFLLSFLNAFAPSRKLRAYVVFNLLLSVLLLIDLWYYRAFRIFPSFTMLHAYRGMPLTVGMVLPFLRWMDLAIFLDLAVLLTPLRFPAGNRRNLRRLGLQACTFLGLFFLVGPVAGHVVGSKAALDQFNVYDSVGETVTTTPIGFHSLELVSFILHKASPSIELSEAERSRIGSWLRQNQEDLPVGKLHGILAGKNLLVIQVESLEYFVLDLKVGGQEVTPALNALKRQGIFFDQFHEQVNSGVSSDADLMTNTSTYPLRSEPTFCVCPSTTLPSLPRILGGRGYQCLSMHPDKGSVWNATQGLTGVGFSPCLDSSAFDCSDNFGMGLSDASFFEQVAPRIAARKSPFYVFMVTQSSHMPFEAPARVRELELSPALDREVMGGYLQSVHYTDKHLGRFLDRLRARGLLENTVVVITGDHQGIHKYYSQEIHESPLLEPWWEEPQRKLPFLILAKGLAPAVVSTQGGQVDIMPTVLDLLGIDAGEWAKAMMGRNLLNTRRNLCTLTDGTVLGDTSDPREVAHCKEGLQIADLIIRGNYFKRATN